MSGYNSRMEPLFISGESLTMDDVVSVARDFRPVRLDPAALPRIQRTRMAVEKLVAEDAIVYGITTGFGRFKDKVIPTTRCGSCNRTWYAATPLASAHFWTRPPCAP